MNKLRELRIKKGRKQKEVAAEIGMSMQALSNYENGLREPDFATLNKLADYFNVTVDYLLGRSDNPLPPEAILVSGEFIALPVIGTITAGYGGVAQEEYTGEKLEIPRELLTKYTPDELYVLTVKGDSMYPELLDGDRVLVYKVSSVDSGTVAVVLYNGDAATVKRVEYQQGGNYIDLVPRNPEFKTKRIVGADLEQCRILGKVIYLFRKF